MFLTCIMYKLVLLLVALAPLQLNAVTYTQEQLTQIEQKYNTIETTIECIDERYCNVDLVRYAGKISNRNPVFIVAITQESKRDWKSENKEEWSYWLCQWHDKNLEDWLWRWDRILSREFKNPHRQIDKCRESFQIREEEWRLQQQISWTKQYYLEKNRKYFVWQTTRGWEVIMTEPL